MLYETDSKCTVCNPVHVHRWAGRDGIPGAWYNWQGQRGYETGMVSPERRTGSQMGSRRLQTWCPLQRGSGYPEPTKELSWSTAGCAPTAHRLSDWKTQPSTGGLISSMVTLFVLSWVDLGVLGEPGVACWGQGPRGVGQAGSTGSIPSPRPRASISGQLPAEYGSFCLWEIVVPLIVSGRVRMILS